MSLDFVLLDSKSCELSTAFDQPQLDASRFACTTSFLFSTIHLCFLPETFFVSDFMANLWVGVRRFNAFNGLFLFVRIAHRRLRHK